MPDKEKRDAVEMIDQQVIYTDDPQERPRRRSRRGTRQGLGCLGTLRLVALLPVLVIALVVGCMMLVMLFEFASFMRDPLDNFLGVFGFDPDAKPEEVDSITIVLGIREMSILETIRSDILITKTVVDSGAAPDAELRVTYLGWVKAGIDLSLVTEDSIVARSDGSLTITLPPAQLTWCDLGKPDNDVDCTDIPFVQDCNAIVDRLQDEAYDRAIEELRETAYELDLLTLANDEAESRVYALLESLGYTRVTFQRSTEELPASETCFAD
jgi:hypothetical protein